MDKLVVASTNAHKVEEIKTYLQKFGIEALSLKDFDAVVPPEEIGDTFLSNAELKAKYYAEKLQMPVLADDSGLCVYSLKNEPGVRSARYSGEAATDQENNELLLKNLEKAKSRNASFQCVIALANPLKKVLTFFVGRCEGEIVSEYKGVEGFGYDPLFMPEGTTKTFAELSRDEKNKISHRGVALRGLEKYLNYSF